MLDPRILIGTFFGAVLEQDVDNDKYSYAEMIALDYDKKMCNLLDSCIKDKRFEDYTNYIENLINIIDGYDKPHTCLKEHRQHAAGYIHSNKSELFKLISKIQGGK